MSLQSPYLGICFPRHEGYYLRHLTFREAPEADVQAWRDAFLWFLKKLTFKYRRPLVLKSPPHTARIRLLLEMFPGARFVHIHRDPYRIFQSFRHYFDTAVWYTYLQRPDRTVIDDHILARYNLLYDAFFEERSLIPEGRFHEMSFEDLERDPMGEVNRLYVGLGLDGFESFRPRLRDYVDSLAGYRKNPLPEIEPKWRRAVAREWRRSFDAWNYPI
jgi:hypothetical protein